MIISNKLIPFLFYKTAEGNQALQDFLMSCNKKKQQSTSLESYLIKPIQRILKYPLLLQQLKNAASANSEEQQHLFDALIGMERVAEHINEMQRIHEEYGAIFDHLFRQHQKASKSVRFFHLHFLPILIIYMPIIVTVSNQRFYIFFITGSRPKSGRSFILWWCRMAEHLRLFG